MTKIRTYHWTPDGMIRSDDDGGEWVKVGQLARVEDEFRRQAAELVAELEATKAAAAKAKGEREVPE